MAERPYLDFDDVSRDLLGPNVAPEPKHRDSAADAALDAYLEAAVAAACEPQWEEMRQVIAIESWETEGDAGSIVNLLRTVDPPGSLRLLWSLVIEMVGRSKRKQGRPRRAEEQRRTKLRPPIHEMVRGVTQILRDRHEQDAPKRARVLIAEKLQISEPTLRVFMNKSKKNREGSQPRSQ